MKKMITKLALATALIVQTAAYSLSFVDVNDLTDETRLNILTGQEPETVIRFEEGVELPFAFALGGDVIEITGERGAAISSIQFKRDVYLRVTDRGALMSFDAEEWSPLWELVTGDCKFGLNACSGQPYIFCGALIDPR